MRRSRRSGIAVAAAVVVGATMLLLWQLGAIDGSPSPSPHATVLVVGDSLVVAATPDLYAESSGLAEVSVLAGLGASPCDMLSGYTQPEPLGGGELSYRSALEAAHPKAVVLAFTGNPGVSRHPCVANPSGDYTLGQLLDGYRSALTAMGAMAEAEGALVYLSAAPPRNPAVPEGWQGSVQYGYNGDPEINSMLSDLARAHGWIYDTSAAEAVSGPGMTWSLRLPCLPEDGGSCHDGQVQVRVGGTDAIHHDAPGANGEGTTSAGSLRYAKGLLGHPLADLAVASRSSPGSGAATSCC